jgi:hypothetical protein
MLRSFVKKQDASRRDAIAAGAAAFGAVLVPAVANAAAGESPRFSVFGLIGDSTSYSEGAAFGTDQSTKLYSPYSVYGNVGETSVFKGEGAVERKMKVLAESKIRVARLPAYIEKKKWMEVTGELSRYMYETRGAVRFLAKTPEQKKAATAFFKAIELTDTSARLKRQDACAAGAAAAATTLNAFIATL